MSVDEMKSMMPLSRRSVLTATGGALLSASLPGTPWAMDKAGEVEALRGVATALAGQGTRTLAPKEVVFIGDLVRTGAASRLHLRLGDRTFVRLGADTELRIDKYLQDAGGELELVGGLMGFARSGPRAVQDLQIRSAYGLIAVRGTRFYAGPAGGTFGVLVTEGRVAVSAGGRSVELAANQGTDIASPGAPPSTPRRWPADRARGLIASVS
ncbi:MAG: FecR family protein [Hyphomicrobiaceae bacterium]|nr:FecR family protein [Hyphomicrobiaceae bacterium]